MEPKFYSCFKDVVMLLGYIILSGAIFDKPDFFKHAKDNKKCHSRKLLLFEIIPHTYIYSNNNSNSSLMLIQSISKLVKNATLITNTPSLEKSMITNSKRKLTTHIETRRERLHSLQKEITNIQME